MTIMQLRKINFLKEAVVLGYQHTPNIGACGKAGNRSETETANENWKRKLETEMQTKDAPITMVQYFLRSVLSHCSSILLAL